MPNDYYRFNLLREVNPQKFMKLSEAKTIDHKLFRGKSLDPIFIRVNEKYYDKSYNFLTPSEVKQILSDLDCEVIIKPDSGRRGKGIKIKHSKDITLNEIPLEVDLVAQHVVKQHPELNSLNPSSINTFRVVTSINSNGSVDVKFTVLRFGRNGQRVDTSSGGWIIVGLDGLPGNIAYDLKGNFLGKYHTDTGKVYSDLSFPFFDKILKLCENLHKSFPYTGIIGWDVFVNEKSVPMLIEWNANNPGFWKFEALYGPFFKEEVENKLFVTE